MKFSFTPTTAGAFASKPGRLGNIVPAAAGADYVNQGAFETALGLVDALLFSARQAKLAALQAAYTGTLAKGITVGGLVLPAQDSDMAKFNALITLCREAENLLPAAEQAAFEAGEVQITDIAGSVHTMTVTQVRQLIRSVWAADPGAMGRLGCEECGCERGGDHGGGQRNHMTPPDEDDSLGELGPDEPALPTPPEDAPNTEQPVAAVPRAQSGELQGRAMAAAAAALQTNPADSGMADLLERLIEVGEAGAEATAALAARLSKASSDISRLEAWAREHRSP